MTLYSFNLTNNYMSLEYQNAFDLSRFVLRSHSPKNSVGALFDAYFIDLNTFWSHGSEENQFDKEKEKYSFPPKIVVSHKKKRIRIENNLSCIFSYTYSIYESNTNYHEASSESSSHSRNIFNYTRRASEITNEIS